MKAITKYLVELVDNTIDTDGGFMTFNGMKIYLPVDQEMDYKAVPQVGRVIDVPRTNRYKLEVGQLIIFHRFIFSNVVSKDVRYIEDFNPKVPSKFQVFAIITDNGYKTLGAKLLVERETVENKSKIIIPDNYKTSQNIAIVKHTSDEVEFEVGDKLGVVQNNFLPLSVFGKDLVMVDSKFSVPYYWRNGEFRVSQDWVMIKADIDNSGYVEQSGLFVPSKRHKDRPIGTVYELPSVYNGSLSVGDKVYFERHEFYSMEKDGEDYYFANEGRLDQVVAILKT